MLHEELLSQLRQVVQPSGLERIIESTNGALRIPGHTRRHSVNTPLAARNKPTIFNARRSLEVPKYKISHGINIFSEPSEAGKIAEIFDQLVNMPNHSMNKKIY